MEYKSSIENVDEITRRVKVTIPVERVSKELEEALDNLQRSVQLKGFRPGKAPRELVRKMHGERLRWEVANRLIDSSLRESLKEHKLNMVGNPEIDIASFDPGKEIEYTAHFSIFPKPEIKGYDKFDLELPKKLVSEDDIQNVLNDMRESKASLRKLEFRNQVQKGDVIDALIGVRIEGSDDESRPEPTVAPIGEGKLPAVLEEGLIGLEVGQSKEIIEDVTEDHPNKDLRGKKVCYAVTLNAISEKVLPEVDDEFAKNLGWNVETLLELRIKVREQLEKAIEQNKASDIQSAILEKLSNENEFPMPQALVDEEILNLLVRNGIVTPAQAKAGEFDVAPYREALEELAKKRLRTAIIVDRIAELEGIQVDKSDVDQELENIAERHQTTKEEVQKFLVKEKLMANTLLDVHRSKVLSFLSDRATVKYV